jgi:GntR family transcriptional repressor for pyruvate dehydrogenase complex
MSGLISAPSLVERVCQILNDERGRKLADRDGRLPSERHLAEKLDVSRPVVREATKRLELQGVLEVRHGAGIRFVDRFYAPINQAVERVLPTTAERLRQLAEARLIIEPEVARLAAARAKAEHRKALRTAQDKLTDAVETADAIEADLEFHRILAQAAGNRILELVLESLGELGRSSRQATLASTGVARAVEHHELILKAVERRRATAAHDAMLAHMEGSARDLAKYFSSRARSAS